MITSALSAFSRQANAEQFLQLGQRLIAPEYYHSIEQQSRQKEALDTAMVVQQMLQQVGILHPDGSIRFESKNFLFEQRLDVVTITAKQDNREVLRVEANRVITFNPTESERERLQYLREQVENDFQQQNPQQQQQEGRKGRSR